MNTKYIFITGGVASSLGKGIISASLGKLLQARGYATQTCSRCIVSLMDRLRQSAEFPHEIGLFLGYPPEDVSAFMEHRDTGCKCVGFWKVYGDEQAARKTFARYKKCSDAYYRQWKKGKPLDRLIITS